MINIQPRTTIIGFTPAGDLQIGTTEDGHTNMSGWGDKGHESGAFLMDLKRKWYQQGWTGSYGTTMEGHRKNTIQAGVTGGSATGMIGWNKHKGFDAGVTYGGHTLKVHEGKHGWSHSFSRFILI